MSGNTNNSSSGIGVFGLLGVLFVALKLMSVVNWSWWLVLLPFYGGIALFFLVLSIIFICTK